MSTSDINLRTVSGQRLHPIGIGTWGYGEYPTFSPGTEAEVAAVRHSLKLGQNHIDTAEMYANGGAELWKNHVAKGLVRPAVEAMLKRLNTSYLDMLYIHAPWFDAPWQEAVPQINELIDEGTVRHFGVSNFNAARLQEVLSLTDHPIAVNQMHYNFAHRQELTLELKELHRLHNIVLVAYMPLGKGDLLGDTSLLSTAQKYRASPPQIALAWLLAQRALPIPKALRQVHIDQNLEAITISLSQEDNLS
jgi:diketogulonate reductase-like aldo/keto reductase